MKTVRSMPLVWAMPALLGAPPAHAQRPAAQKPGVSPARISSITIRKFQDVEWRPEDNWFRSPGPVLLSLQPSGGGDPIEIDADDAEGSATTFLKVKGRLTLRRPEGRVTGESLQYDMEKQYGSILNARAEADNLFVKGAKIEVRGNQTLEAHRASFTTCEKERPDYHITASSLSLSPQGKVRAKGVTLWLGRTPILAVPSLEQTFRRKVENPFPTPAYSKETGLRLQTRSELIATERTSAAYMAQLSMRRAPRGYVEASYDLGRGREGSEPPPSRAQIAEAPLVTALETKPTFVEMSDPTETRAGRTLLYGAVALGSATRNRLRTDIRVSRLPEVGLHLVGFGGRPAKPPGGSGGPEFDGAVSSPAGWEMNADLSVGRLSEKPSGVTSARLSLKTECASPFVRLGRTMYARIAVTSWCNAYGAGRSYALAAPEVELGLRPSKRFLLSAAYRRNLDTGSTPFLFDRKDLNAECRLRAALITGQWISEGALKYETSTWRAYDMLLSLRRRLDCIEYGVSYQVRGQGLGLIINLLPGARKASAARGETRK